VQGGQEVHYNLLTGKLLIGGYFSTLNGDSRGGIAWLNRNGTLDSGFLNGLSGTDGWVDWVAAQSNGNVLIKGSFTAVNGVPTGNIAVLWGNRTSFIETLAGPASGSATLTLRLPLGSTNRVQYKTNLTDANWTSLGNALGGNSINQSVSDPVTKGARFYRVQVQ